jgi:isopentenyl-diphosphate Delta-isomerase
MEKTDSAAEHLDVLDPQGRPTGIVKSRDDVHRAGLWHRTAHVWIINGQNQLLLQKRARTKESFPGLWDVSAAGHITAGDESRKAGVRELKEELGIDVKNGEMEYLFTVNQKYEDRARPFIDNEITDVYVVRKKLCIDDIVIDKKEVENVAFARIDKFRMEIKKRADLYVPHPEEYARLFEVITFK